MKIDQWYSEALTAILTEGSKEVNKRTGMEVSALPGLTFQTDLEKDGLPLLSLRKIPVKNFIAEQCWFLSGSNKIEDLEKYTKIWNLFAIEGRVSSAYGYRWRNHFPVYGTVAQEMAELGVKGVGKVDQLEYVLNTLKADPSSRHGVVMMWDPGMDLLIEQKNVPCPYTFTLMIIGGRLHMHVVVRSNDMVLGFPTDAAGFAWLTYVLAAYLKVKPGIYTHSISNAHIYSNHYDAAKEMVARAEVSTTHPPIEVRLASSAYGMACRMDQQFISSAVNDVYIKYFPLDSIPGLTISV